MKANITSLDVKIKQAKLHTDFTVQLQIYKQLSKTKDQDSSQNQPISYFPNSNIIRSLSLSRIKRERRL